MKPLGDYHPPESWVKFETLKVADTFHDVINGQPVQFMKIEQCCNSNENNAVNLTNGKLSIFSDDEFVYPVDAGWIAEMECWVKLPEDVKNKRPHDILTYIFNRCGARAEADRWRNVVTKYFPGLQIMSFSGPTRTISWMLDQIEEKGLPEKRYKMKDME